MEETMDTREQAKAVILGIIDAAGECFAGQVRLYKAFWAAHLYHHHREAGELTGHPVVRMPHGPGIDDGEAILAELVAANRLRKTEQPCGPYTEQVFHLTGDAPQLGEAQRRSILEAVAWVNGRSGAELSQFTHEHSREWNRRPDGVEMTVALDAMSEPEYQAMKKRQASVADDVAAAFGA